MNATTEAASPKDQLALALATALGAGYLPLAPGTFGSLAGSLLSFASFAFWFPRSHSASLAFDPFSIAVSSRLFFLSNGILIVVASLTGLWAAGRVSRSLGNKDPQIVVIDEVAGQMIAYLGLGITPDFAFRRAYLLAGFVLFRLFDIWKPFPIRRAESLPAVGGIMADDWLAGLYAAVLLALARHFGF